MKKLIVLFMLFAIPQFCMATQYARPVVDAQKLYINGTEVTATAAEINAGVDGLTATATEINNLCDGATTTATEVNLLDGSVAGTAVASKAAVLGANKELDEFHTAALYIGAGAGTAVTSTAAELNILDGVTATYDELNILDGVDKTTAEINTLPITVKTTVDASGGGTGSTTNCALLPAGSLLLNVLAVVVTPFDGDTTKTLEVGVSGNADNYIDTSDFDPGAAAGTSAVSNGGTNNDQKINEYIASETQLIATWTNTANMTAGDVSVYVTYIELP